MTITHDDPTVNGKLDDGMHLSPKFLEANRRLHKLRAKQAQHSAEKEPDVPVVPCVKREVDHYVDHYDVENIPPPPTRLDTEHYPQPTYSRERLNSPHPTYDLEVINRRLRAQQIAFAEAQKSPARQQANVNISVSVKAQLIDTDIDIKTVLLHPSIAVALLQRQMVAVGRLWLLARSLDAAGSGRINITDLRKTFTDKESAHRICGWRRMRILLEQGEKQFWERDKDGRLWIYGVGHVASMLGLEKVEGVAVHVDVKALLNIRSCRAHFYASWFSGRKTTNPISRAKLTALTGVSEEQQRLYEQIANVDVTSCLAIGERYSLEGMQEAGYQRGAVRGHNQGVVFEFVDHKGKQGKAGEKYVAWHLPNRYIGRHKQAGKSSRRNINRYLKRRCNLEEKLALGNADCVDAMDDELVVPLFFPHLKAAAKRRKKVRTTPEIYWEGTSSRSAQLWHVVPQGQGGKSA